MNNLPVKFAKLWERCDPHPNNEITVQVAIVIWVVRTEFVDWLGPVWWADEIFVRILESVVWNTLQGWVLIFVFLIHRPCDVFAG